MAASTKTNTSIKRKKVIISSYDDIKNPYYAGGGAFAIHTLASRLTKNFDVLIFTGTYSGSVDEVVESVQYKRIGCSLFGPRIAQVFYQIALLRIILTQDFDIWFESFTPPFSTSCLQLFTQKPVVGLVHMLAGEDMTRKYKLPFVFFEKLGLKTYRHFVVLSQHFQEKIHNINPSASIQVIPNGIEIPNTTPNNNKTERNSVGFIGRLEVNQKGLDLLLAAYAVVENAQDTILEIAGTGRAVELQEINNLVNELQIQDRTLFLGRVSGQFKKEFFNRVKLLVIPSRFETFSITALEAFANGLPLVCFDIDGFQWVPDNCAMKVKEFTKAALADAIAYLLQNPAKAEEMTKNALMFVRRFDWAQITTESYSFA
jgi:glycosyltransferase involved in cell wall biosynthesis